MQKLTHPPEEWQICSNLLKCTYFEGRIRYVMCMYFWIQTSTKTFRRMYSTLCHLSSLLATWLWRRSMVLRSLARNSLNTSRYGLDAADLLT